MRSDRRVAMLAPNERSPGQALRQTGALPGEAILGINLK